MSIETLREYIRNRIIEAQHWESLGFRDASINIYLRKYPCAVRPLKFINDANKEGKGIRFRVSWRSELGVESYSDIDIFIVPEGFSGDRSEYPYVTIYAVNPESRSYRLQKDNCKVILLDDYVLKDSNLGKTGSIQQFFTELLKRVCLHERCASLLFRYQKPASE